MDNIDDLEQNPILHNNMPSYLTSTNEDRFEDDEEDDDENNHDKSDDKDLPSWGSSDENSSDSDSNAVSDKNSGLVSRLTT